MVLNNRYRTVALRACANILMNEIGRFDLHFVGGLFGLSKRIMLIRTIEGGKRPLSMIKLKRSASGCVRAGRCRNSSDSSPSGPGAFLSERESTAFLTSMAVNFLQGALGAGVGFSA